MNTDNNPSAYNKEFRNIIMMTIAIAVILIAALWIWKAIQIHQLKKQFQADQMAQMQRAADDQHRLQENTTAQIDKLTQTHLALLGKPFSWAVRSELLTSNLKQIDFYMTDMVKGQYIQKIVIADPSGRVLLSTNKKDEGQMFLRPGLPSYLNTDSIAVTKVNDSLLQMISPVMGFNKRLGTIILVSKVVKPFFK